MVKQCKPLRTSYGPANQKIYFFFEVPRVSPGNKLLAKEPEDSGYEIDRGWGGGGGYLYSES